mmetsp:Transcript_96461/g.273156  ORF Transcript_96461/g.273156 Transcript_96461/m.273156 type:complete len:612 (+) Transcript_96461:105-1940(+)
MALSRVSQAFKGFKRPPCHRCAPTLLSQDGAEGSANAPAFSNDSALVLAALGEDGWRGRWALNGEESAELLRSIEAGSDQMLTLEEILHFARDEGNRERLLELPGAVHGLLSDTMVTEAFSRFDADGSGQLNVAEWNEFLNRLEHLHLKYLLRLAFHNFRAYFGRGRPQCLRATGCAIERDLESAAGASACAPRAAMQVGCDPDLERPTYNPFPAGWWADFCYYSANNHPLHGILACDPVHPLSWIERLAMELATIGMSHFSAGLHQSWVVEGRAPLALLANGAVFSLVMVTLLGMAMWWTLFLLFACKCGQVDASQATRARQRSARALRCAGATVAHSLCALGIGALVWQSFLGWDVGLLVARARLQSYVIFWLLMAFVYFNPVVAWGTPDPSKPQSGPGDLIGLGQWRIEKQRFQALCLQALERRRAQPPRESLIAPERPADGHPATAAKGAARALLAEYAGGFRQHPVFARAKEAAAAAQAHPGLARATDMAAAAQAHPMLAQAREAAGAAQARPVLARAREAAEAAQAMLADDGQGPASGEGAAIKKLLGKVSTAARSAAQVPQGLAAAGGEAGQGLLASTQGAARALLGEGARESRGYQLVAAQED